MSITNFTMLVRDRLPLVKQAINTLAAPSMNVTVVDDRSQPDTRLWLERTSCLFNMHVVRNDTPMGTGFLRNLAVEESRKQYGRGNYLYLSDSDVVFSPYWLDKLLTAYEYAWTYGYRVLGGYNHPFHQPISRIMGVYEVGALASQSMLMKWEVWDEFGSFCETPVDRVCQSEDVEFSNHIRAAGYKVGVTDPWLVANTGITNSFGEHIPGWELVKSQCPRGVICE